MKNLQYYFLFLFLISSFYSLAQNSAILLDGTADYLTIDHKPNQNIGDAYTIEAWIFANNWTTEVWRGSIVGKDNQGPDRGYAFRCGDNGKLSFVIAVDNVWEETVSSSLMNVNQWHHVAGVVNNGAVKLYIDGQEVAAGSFTGTPSNLPQPLHIGASAGFDGRFFDGVIDEVRIWNVARTPTEIADNATVDLTGSETGLAVYLPMNEGSGMVATNLVDAACSATGVSIGDNNWVDGYTLPMFDLSLQAITGIDQLNMKTRPIQVTARVQNTGTSALSNFQIDVSINGNIAISETINETLAAGELMSYLLETPADFTEYSDIEIEATVSHPNDENGLNNSTTANLTNIPGNNIVLFKQTTHNFGGAGQNKFNSVVLPYDLAEYEQLLMRITLSCPSGGCDPWDQPAKVTAFTAQGSFELARYITPYGIACGPWTIDVTDFKTIFQGEVDYNSYIQVWGPNGWNATVELELIEGNAAMPYQKVTPIYQMDYQVYGDPGISHDLPEVEIMVDNNTEASHARIQLTGHGQGNTENAAEFSNKTHSFQVNGSEVAQHNLWKDDCASNACADQNGNWLFSRAGWCPGQEVQPYIVETTGVAAPGTSAIFDYVFEDYVNLLNTGYNDSGHTEPHYRKHDFFIEKSSERYQDYTNLLTADIEPIITSNMIESVSITVINNGNTSVSNFMTHLYLNGTSVGSFNFGDALAPGEGTTLEFTPATFPGLVLANGDNFFYGEVDINIDENPGDDWIKSDVFSIVNIEDQIVAQQFNLTPNPSNSFVNIELDESLISGQLQVYNINGSFLLERTINSTNEQIELDHAGTYFVKIINTDGHTASKKLVIIK